MMKFIQIVCLVFIGLVASCYSTTGPIRASETDPVQTLETYASLEGKITVEGSGTAVVNAIVTLTEARQIWSKSVSTNETGQYKLSELASGDYVMDVRPPNSNVNSTSIHCGTALNITGTVCSEFYNNKPNSAAANRIKLYPREKIRNFDISLAQGVMISGVVSTEDTLQPLAGVLVTPLSPDDANTKFYSTYTGADGTYTLKLPRGNYKMHFAYHEGYIGEYFPKRGQLKDAEVIYATQSITNVNATMTKGGLISGKVNFTDTEKTLWSRIRLIPLDNANSWDYPRTFNTDLSGFYTFTVPSGRYVIKFLGVWGGYAGEYYNGQSQAINAMPISITAPSIVTNINARLDIGGAITGQLKLAPIGYPGGSSAIITLIDADTGETIVDTQTQTGNYEIRGIQTGRYKLMFSTLLDATGLGNCISTRYYPNAGTFEGAEVIKVIRPNTTANINATLYPCDVFLNIWLPLVRR